MQMTGINGLRSLLALGLMSGLVACGALPTVSIAGSPPPPVAAGIARATHLPYRNPRPPRRKVAGLVLDDGSYWLFYTAKGQPTVLAGLVQGTGTSHSGSFGSSNTREFNLEGAGIRATTMRGRYVPSKSFDGTIAYVTGETESFTSTSAKDSESAPNLTLVAGTYAGLRTDHHTVTVTVDAAGTLSGDSTDGCTVAGILSPRGKGNVFHTSVTFEGGACRQGTETVTGVTFFDAATNRLYSAALNPARTSSFISLGTKQ